MTNSDRVVAGKTAGKVDFAWLFQAFKLFGSNAGLWISASLIAFGAPVVFTVFVYLLNRVSSKVGGVAGGTGLPHGVLFAVTLTDTLFSAFIAAGIATMAVKKVSGQPITGRDIFGGARIYPSFLLFSIVAQVLVSVGLALLILPGVFIAGLLLPAYAMIADGESVGAAIGKSMKAMWPDRFVAAGFVFVLGIVVSIGMPILGIGIPILLLVSALACRDMFGLRSMRTAPTGPDTLPWETADAQLRTPSVSLTGEPIDNGSNAPSEDADPAARS